jgi:hypothetical protein
MPQDIVLSIPNSESNLAELFEANAELQAVRLPGAGMDGGGELLVLLIPFTHFAIKTVVDLLKAHMEQAKHVKVEMDGMTFSGASLREISDFLDRHPPRDESHQGH